MRTSIFDQLRSFLLPFTVLLIIPAAILWPTGFRIGWGLGWPWDGAVVMLGAVIIGSGLYFLAACIRLFMFVGRGTLAPWSPTRKLVIVGPYQYVRNPMISSVLAILLGEAIAFGSVGILAWFLLALGINHVYFIISEEPGLYKRFGDEYLEYKKNVPRWIPRLTPWSCAKS